MSDNHETEYRQRLQQALGDDYELHRLIGSGGFGTVYAAFDRRLERDVAVKTLRYDLFPTNAVLERFQREARAVAKLRHPNILPVYSVGQGEGLAFMVMPLIQGETLGQTLRVQGRLPPDEAIRIGAAVGRALHVAHRVGIVHRDVKPENILLEGDERHPLLADFGIAKAMDSDGELTRSGMIVGSPQYMSPEQAAGERNLDARSDIYSLGAVIYEMLAGRRPYEAANFQQLIVQQYTTEPPQIARLAPEIPTVLAEAVMRSLTKDPTGRWSSADEFASALLATGAAPAAVTSEGPARRSWLERRGPLAILLGLVTYYLQVTSGLLAVTGRAGVVPSIRPIVALFELGLVVLLGEMLWGMISARMNSGSWNAAFRAAFGQPRWWQVWYPRALRHPANVWDRMSPVVKVLRTILSLELAAVPVAVPLIFVIPNFNLLWSGANLQLPLPIRLTIAVSQPLKWPMVASLVLLFLGVAALSVRSRIPVSTVLRCLLTWRDDQWNSVEARRLLRTPNQGDRPARPPN